MNKKTMLFIILVFILLICGKTFAFKYTAKYFEQFGWQENPLFAFLSENYSQGLPHDYTSVSISGNQAIMAHSCKYTIDGPMGDPNGIGYAIIYEKNEETWSETSIVRASGGTVDDLFGWSASIANDNAIVGAWGYYVDTGAAYTFEKINGTWQETNKLTASDHTIHDRFGYSVSMSGNQVVIGSIQDANENGYQAGSAYIFEKINGTWTEVTKLTASDGAANDHFGHSVSISGDQVIVGANSRNNLGTLLGPGAIYIFEKVNGIWSEMYTKKGESVGANLFGRSVSISGDKVVTGADGAIFILEKIDNTWLYTTHWYDDTFPGESFGHSVSISGDQIIIGAGPANIFIVEKSNGAWFLQANLSHDCSASVSISDSQPMVGCSPGSSYYVVPQAYIYERIHYCKDNDGDGYGDPADDSCLNSQRDCDNSNRHIFPSNSNEYCDCDGSDAPITAEICNDGQDNDCDGLIDKADLDCFHECEGNSDYDIDVDGSDLAMFAGGGTESTIENFAGSYGKADCQSILVIFPDQNLDEVIRKAINKPEGDIYYYDLAGVKMLEARDKNISTISGLEYCTNLIRLDLSENNQLTDISPLSSLVNLITLDLSAKSSSYSSNLTDINPISGLVNLTWLDLSYNRYLTDISPLSGLVNLILLDLSYNVNLIDINSISGLVNLTWLDLSDNTDVTDISPLSGLVNLTTLDLSAESIAYPYNLTDISPLSDLINLTALDLSYNTDLTDIGPLSGLVNLILLDISNINPTDISPLSGLINLTWLDLSRCHGIFDFTPLLDNYGLNSGDYLDINYGSIGDDLSNGCIIMPQLESRGVHVAHNCPCIDNDEDGYGDGDASKNCTHSAKDCDDGNANVHPGSVEVCGNGIDDDCDGLIDGDDECNLVQIPPGCFDMGDHFNEGDSSELPVHNVCLSTYQIDKYEVTNTEYEECVAAGACTIPIRLYSNLRDPYYGVAAYYNYPVVYVAWNQAHTYCEWSGKRLPTEAEWEYAARAGLSGERYPWGGISPNLENDISCTDANYGRDDFGSCWDFNGLDNDTQLVGSYEANGYGLYDMAGNVWEWVNDYYDPIYYSVSLSNDPTGPSYSTSRVMRGGSWYNEAGFLRVADRFPYEPQWGFSNVGIRCARDGP